MLSTTMLARYIHASPAFFPLNSSTSSPSPPQPTLQCPSHLCNPTPTQSAQVPTHLPISPAILPQVFLSMSTPHPPFDFPPTAHACMPCTSPRGRSSLPNRCSIFVTERLFWKRLGKAKTEVCRKMEEAWRDEVGGGIALLGWQ